MAELRKYGVQTKILFPLLTAGDAEKYLAGATIAAGDVKISKDEGAFTNTTNTMVDEGSGWYSITLTATEMQAAKIMVLIVDQTATEEWFDQGVVIDTYGNASAEHAFDLDEAQATLVDSVWNEALSGHVAVGSVGRALQLAGVVLAETTLTGTPTTTTFPLTAGSAVDDFYNDMTIIFIDGALAGSARIITDYTGSTKTVTIDEPLTSAPSSGDAAIIKATHSHSLSQIGAEVNSQVLDVLMTDTFAELSSVPAGDTTILKMLTLLFMMVRNKITETESLQTLRNEGDSADVGTAAISTTSTTFTKGNYT